MKSLRKIPSLDSAATQRKNGARPYDRLSQLSRLIGLWPAELQDHPAAGTTKILALLRKALRSERSRGRSGHWTYDLNRHLALAESVKAERAHLRSLNAVAVITRRAPTRAPAPSSVKILHLPMSVLPTRAARFVSAEGDDQPVLLLPSLAESSS
jgi:hypothetical protein